MRALHYFNPGHETAVWLERPNYTPPANVRKMILDLAYLPAWYAGSEDFVWTGEHDLSEFHAASESLIRQPLAKPLCRERLREKPSDFPEMLAAPWGQSPQASHLFASLKQPWIVAPAWDKRLKALTGRQTAARCLRLLHERMPGKPLPDVPCFYQSREELLAYLNTHAGQTLILKSPYSSSGRGLLWIHPGKPYLKETDWAAHVIEKQGTVSIEPALENHQDFAMEFYSDGKGEIRYEGLSVFSTGERGAYGGNLLGDESLRERILLSYVQADELEAIRENLRECLKALYAHIYTGYLGVDMLIYRRHGSWHIHPCVEINLRYTMGMVALRLSRRFVAPGSTGHFFLSYQKEPGEALREHREMLASHPPVLRDGRISEGYVSCCPVDEQTNYRAYMMIT